MMKLDKIEAWTIESWSGKRYKWAEATRFYGAAYKSVQSFYDLNGACIATHPQEYLTVEDAAEMWLESDYEVVVSAVTLDDGRYVYRHFRHFGEPETSAGQVSGKSQASLRQGGGTT